jgi:hypothetical protein
VTFTDVLGQRIGPIFTCQKSSTSRRKPEIKVLNIYWREDLVDLISDKDMLMKGKILLFIPDIRLTSSTL